jgi:phage-related protein
MAAEHAQIPVRFYRTEAGGEPVLEWLRGLDKPDRRSLPRERTARLLLCFHEETLVALHGFIKKTRKTPASDLALARRRMKEVTT